MKFMNGNLLASRLFLLFLYSHILNSFFSTTAMKLNRAYEYVEGKIGGAFADYGRFVSRHAWKIIIITIIVNAVLGIGMSKLQSDIETDNVYLPQSTYKLYL